MTPGVTVSARRAVIRIKSVFRAFRQAFKDIAADISNVPADYKAQRILVDGLRRQYQRHYERKQAAQKLEPTGPGGDGRIC